MAVRQKYCQEMTRLLLRYWPSNLLCMKSLTLSRVETAAAALRPGARADLILLDLGLPDQEAM